MLAYFEVQGFKNFDQPVSLDLRNVRDYQFNEKCVKNGLVHNAILYGKNSVGKTNFGLALFDVVSHLTSNNVSPGLYDYYLSTKNGKGTARFRYVFRFGTDEVEYEYEKEAPKKLLSERLSINGEQFLLKNYDSPEKDDFSGVRQLAPTLNYSFEQDGSVLRYVLNNTALEKTHPLYRMMRFVSNMLWARCLEENRYIGYRNDSSNFFTFLLRDPAAFEAFQELLSRAGVELTLHIEEDPDGKARLYAAPADVPTARLPFYRTASSGTKALYTYFYWKTTAPEASLFFLDEFDAFYHFELAETLQKELQEFPCQVIVTSHNTNLLSNRIMRPDCYFILTPGKLVSFSQATRRELREGHNLEKLFMSGEFDG